MSRYSYELELFSRSIHFLFPVAMAAYTSYAYDRHALLISNAVTIPFDILDNPCLRKYIYEFLGFPPVACPYDEFLARPDAIRFIVS